jgi:hypothetical protein
MNTNAQALVTILSVVGLLIALARFYRHPTYGTGIRALVAMLHLAAG